MQLSLTKEKNNWDEKIGYCHFKPGKATTGFLIFMRQGKKENIGNI